ncbi:MAG TPA: hypothetical protein VJ385_20050 [Fibrobacteria bacterium]|nr:hypothetical protein [Fibrobacteria bacterium]
MSVLSITASADKKKVFLKVDSLKAGKVVHVELDSNKVTSGDGKRPWTTEAWYTLNRLSIESTSVAIRSTAPAVPGWVRAYAQPAGAIVIRSETGGSYAIRDGRGVLLEEGHVEAYQAATSVRRYRPGLYVVSVNGVSRTQVIRL